VCPQTYYCPQGSGNLNYLEDLLDYTDPASHPPTRCPRGTGQDGEDTKKTLTQCKINEKHKLLEGILTIRSEAGSETEEEEDPEVETAPASEEMDGRRLITEAIVIVDTELSSLYEIDFQIQEEKEGFINNIQNDINLDRTYVARWCPLNLTLVSEYIED